MDTNKEFHSCTCHVIKEREEREEMENNEKDVLILFCLDLSLQIYNKRSLF